MSGSKDERTIDMFGARRAARPKPSAREKFVHAVNFVRLVGQSERIYRCMSDGVWRTLDEIADSTNDPVASISAQLRHLRKASHGRHTIERRSRDGHLFEYRLRVSA